MESFKRKGATPKKASGFMSPRDPLFINSLAKGLGILEAFSAHAPKLNLSELAEATGLHKAAVQRYTHTLLKLGYLERGPDKRYFLAPRVMLLGYALLQGSELVERVRSYLREFAETLNCSVNFSILDDTKALVLFRHEIRRSFFQYDIQAGTKLPLYCTSMGKVLLASLPDDELKTRISRLTFDRLTERTITDPEQLFMEVLKVRESGVGEADREASSDLHSMAVPLIGQDAKLAAAISISTPANQPGGMDHAAVRRRLIEKGRKLSSLMGYGGPYPMVPVNSAV